jgi:hypothetical protein
MAGGAVWVLESGQGAVMAEEWWVSVLEIW